ncbi:2-hydroxyacid dehydrogenase [Alkalicoccus daliensis]|uniref:Glyoxylate reductase n=1 Tax=Alkalicoccus daliensis TaxID=745820 RepID=A0A1H0JFN6_9BACI|nr:D-glycerate dehydrogenase [Alkalicoccus daliensis]SDO42454.1 glyoxylate reductase [Alkalicoccus daliensis]
MSKPYVYVTRKLPEELLHVLSQTAEVECWEETDKPVPREILLEKSRNADGLLTMLSDKVDKELLEQAASLKVVANLAVGYDNIDLEEAETRNVIVCNTPDVLTDATADLAFALLMAAARRIPEADQYVKKDKWHGWAPFMFAGADVHKKTLGIIGMGRIGTAVAKRAAGFDMEILYHNRSRKKEIEQDLGVKYAEKKELLEKADFVCVVAPLTTETRGMIGKGELEQMKKSAYLINVSRGPVVDEKALIEAMQNEVIAGAGLDVFEQEPIRAEHPLLKFPQVVALPHIGSATTATREEMAELCARNIAAVLKGEKAETPLN